MSLSSRGLWSRGLTGRAAAWQHAHRGRSEERAARKLHLAERAADAAAARYRELRAAASADRDGAAPRGPMPTWQQLLLLVVGGGLLAGLLMMWLLAAAYVGPAAMLVLPVVAGLVAAFIALRRRHRPEPKVRRPLVADLVRATQELHDAEAALQRVRGARDGEARPAPEPPAARPWPRSRPEAPQT